MSDQIGSVSKPEIRPLLWAKDNGDGTKTIYTTNPQILNISVSESAPSLDSAYPGIYVQIPNE